MIKESARVIEKINGNAVAVFTDGDRTAWARNAAEYGIGLTYIRNAFCNCEMSTVLYGITSYLKIKKKFGQNGEKHRDNVEILELFYSNLNKAGIGKVDEMEQMAYYYISNNIIKSTWEIISSFDNRFLVSCNGSSVANAANRIFKFNDFKSNRDIFDQNGLITGIQVDIPDGEAKARYMFNTLSKYGIELKNVIYIGDGETDIPALNMVGFPIASPFAIEAVKAASHYVLKDKMTICIRR